MSPSSVPTTDWGNHMAGDLKLDVLEKGFISCGSRMGVLSDK